MEPMKNKTYEELEKEFLAIRAEERARAGPNKINVADVPIQRVMYTYALGKTMHYKKVPQPKVVRYYYGPDREIVFVYDDGIEVSVEDTTRDDKALRRDGWVPITNEMSLAASEVAKKEAKNPYLLYLNEVEMKEYKKRNGIHEEVDDWDFYAPGPSSSKGTKEISLCSRCAREIKK